MSFWAFLLQPWMGVDTSFRMSTVDRTSNPHTYSGRLNSTPLKIYLCSEPQNSAFFGKGVFQM